MSSWWTHVCFFIIQIPVRFFVKSKPIPTDPISELNLDTKRPVLYVLPYNSKVDLLVVRSLAMRLGLPDPLKPLNIGEKVLPAYLFIDKGYGFFTSKQENQKSIDLLSTYISLHQQNQDLDIQMLPVSVMFGRKPNKEGKKSPSLQVLNSPSKFFKMLFSGRDCYTRFSHPVSLNAIPEASEKDRIQLGHKLSRVARIHFSKQRMAAIGPKLPDRKEMLTKLLGSDIITDAISEEEKSKNISYSAAQKNALSMLNEIAANFSYRMLRITDSVLSWAWNRLYQGLKVTNADPVRSLAQNGHEIVYAPCHRSHMDYLLLSYVLYQQGLVPPHIAAGINLNFWPAGPIFRRLGAFFIRRSFKGNKLYTAVFREYLAELFTRGYSVEYFIEGGRSRTGKLLDPKTGMLLMTIQTLLRGEGRPITVVPIYIGYEHVLEVATYENELRGAKKQKESLGRTIKAFFKLKRLGYGYVNFGKPIPVNQFLNQQVSNWREAIEPTGTQRPSWLTPTTNLLAKQIMENINASAAVNAMNLCCTILLCADQHTLTQSKLITLLDNLLLLLRNVRYSDLVTIPNENGKQLFEHAKEMGKFVISKDHGEEYIGLTPDQAILMTYYRNNIQHLLIIPALIARILFKHSYITRTNLVNQIKLLYPLIKAELFLYQDESELENYIENIINIFIQLEFIEQNDEAFQVNLDNKTNLQILAASSKDTLQRYAIIFSLLAKNSSISRGLLEKEGRTIAERLSVLHGINSPEFFDKGIFSTLVSSIREQGYLDDAEKSNIEKIQTMNNILQPLITNRVMHSINEFNCH